MGMVPRTMAFKMCQSNGSIRKNDTLNTETQNTIETNIQTPWTGTTGFHTWLRDLGEGEII